MGMDISGNGGDLRCSGSIWYDVLKLGLHHGWEPLGTHELLDPDLSDPTEDPEWDGNYLTNDWQFITAEDANHLADALKRALDGAYDNSIDMLNLENLDDDRKAVLTYYFHSTWEFLTSPLDESRIDKGIALRFIEIVGDWRIWIG